MAKGDATRVIYDLNDGKTALVEWSVERAGRALEVTTNRKDGTLEVEEKTASGTVTRSISVRLDRVISVEQVSARA